VLGLQQFHRKDERTTIEGTKFARPQGRFTYASNLSQSRLWATNHVLVITHFYHQWQGSESVKIGRVYEIRLPRNATKSREAYKYGFGSNQLEEGSHPAHFLKILAPSWPHSANHAKSKPSTAPSVSATWARAA